MDQILRFFEPKADLNVVLAGYVSEVIGKLMEVYYYEVSKYLLNNPQKLNWITQHMYDTSVCKNILTPLIFKPERDIDLETSVLEKKLEREHIDKLLRPLRAKLLKDIWAKYISAQNVELVTNLLQMLKEAVNRSTKEESFKSFLHETVYSQNMVDGLFKFLLNTEVGLSVGHELRCVRGDFGGYAAELQGYSETGCG